jgi:hypothetical protein
VGVSLVCLMQCALTGLPYDTLCPFCTGRAMMTEEKGGLEGQGTEHMLLPVQGVSGAR